MPAAAPETLQRVHTTPEQVLDGVVREQSDSEHVAGSGCDAWRRLTTAVLTW
jgi:hypothetical protein